MSHSLQRQGKACKSFVGDLLGFGGNLAGFGGRDEVPQPVHVLTPLPGAGKKSGVKLIPTQLTLSSSGNLFKASKGKNKRK